MLDGLKILCWNAIPFRLWPWDGITDVEMDLKNSPRPHFVDLDMAGGRNQEIGAYLTDA